MPTEKKPVYVDETLSSITGNISEIEESVYMISSAAQALAKLAYVATCRYMNRDDSRSDEILKGVSKSLALDESFGKSDRDKWRAHRTRQRTAGDLPEA